MGIHNYKYLEIINGLQCYGEIDIELKVNKDSPRVTDLCSFNKLREEYVEFIISDPLKLMKINAILAIEAIIENYEIPSSFEFIIHDINIVIAHTRPSHIGVAAIIAVFDIIGNPISRIDLNSLNQFVEENSEEDTIPNYSRINLNKVRK